MKKVNPFEEGVTYEAFLAALGKAELETYLKEFELTAEQITWLKLELEQFNNNKNI